VNVGDEVWKFILELRIKIWFIVTASDVKFLRRSFSPSNLHVRYNVPPWVDK
jgi:hypothetical protein